MCACVPKLARKKNKIWSLERIACKTKFTSLNAVVGWKLREWITQASGFNFLLLVVFGFTFAKRFIIMCNTKQADLAQPDWLLLDDLVMGKIFTILSVRDRFNASLVGVCHPQRKVNMWNCVDCLFDSSGLSSLVNVLRTSKSLAKCRY